MEQNIREIKKNHADYPELLAQINDPPEQLYVWGELPKDRPMLGVVGTRKVSPYGKQVTPLLVKELARAGVVIVSGLAYGIDALAHEAALEAKGITVAVLGSGLDRASLYPRDHWRLAGRIMEAGGAVISEYPEGTPPEKYHFPARNRIVAGLSQGVLVVEAPEKSGALITADLAMQYNRDVFCVPGPITSVNSLGTNRFIQTGAKLVTNAEDILEELGVETTTATTKQTQKLPEQQHRILAVLETGPQSIDAIVKSTRLDITSCNVGVVELELSGHIKNLGGGLYART